MLHFYTKIILSFIDDATIYNILCQLFKSCLNQNPRKARHQPPRQMSPDIITPHNFSNVWYCMVELWQKRKKMKKWKSLKTFITQQLSVWMCCYLKNYIEECIDHSLYDWIVFCDPLANESPHNITSWLTTDLAACFWFLENSCHFEPSWFDFVPGKHHTKQKKND